MEDCIVYDKFGREMAVMLNKDKVWTAVHVHELVAEAFIPNPGNMKHIRHKDGNIRNNRADNLEWTNTPEFQFA